MNIDDDQFVENVGYALRKQRKNTRFPVKVKEYLNKLFEIGEISGKKGQSIYCGQANAMRKG